MGRFYAYWRCCGSQRSGRVPKAIAITNSSSEELVTEQRQQQEEEGCHHRHSCSSSSCSMSFHRCRFNLWRL